MADIKDIAKDIISDVKEEIEEVVEEIQEDDDVEEITDDKIDNDKKHLKKKNKKTLIMALIAILLFILCIFLIVVTFTIRTQSLNSAYNSTKEEAESSAYENTGKMIFAIGEKRYHTSNDVTIYIDGIKARFDQNILTVLEWDYYIHEGNSDVKSKAWYKITRDGTFVVNMNLAEIITDAERKYILIRVPEPTLQMGNISVETYNFEGNIFEGLGDGVSLAQNVTAESGEKIREKIAGNQDYFIYAKNLAQSQLIQLAKDCNPNLDVEVAVEFF